VFIGTFPVIQNLDVFAKQGARSILHELVSFTYRNDQIQIMNEIVDEGLIDKQLNINFRNKGKNLPFVSGAIIFKGSMQGIFNDRQFLLI